MGKSLKINGATFLNGLSFKSTDMLSSLDANETLGNSFGLYVVSGKQFVLRGVDTTRSCSFVHLDDFLKLYSSITITPKSGYKFAAMATDRIIYNTNTGIIPFAWNTSALTVNFSSMLGTIYDSLALNVAKTDNTDVDNSDISDYIDIVLNP